MTRVCLVGDDDVQLRYELLSRETSRDALRTYDLHAPFENTVGVETVSLGAAVSLLNDLNWYLVRFVADALVLEPSISDEEWLSRAVATAIREDDRKPAETDRLFKVYGVEDGEVDEPPRLVEPMYLTRVDGELPTYDLRDVDDTLLVRVTESEFEQG
jgi:hypothetical protein